jgi:Zn-dependent peptidase ImmA (M78 family)
MTEFSFLHRLLPAHIETLSYFTKQVPVQIGALAQALGLKVVVAALPLNISGMIQPDGEDGFIIKVNRFEPKERQRFTIAHEIAHYLLHRDRISAGVVDSVLYRSKLSSRLEAEANRLAADIIMPMDQVQAMISATPSKNHDDLVASLAEAFKVSKQAMGIRTGQ